MGVDVAHGHRVEQSPRRSSEGEVDVCEKAHRTRGPGLGDLKRARTWGLCSMRDDLIREVAHGVVVGVRSVGDIDDWDGDDNSCAVGEVGEDAAQNDRDGVDELSSAREPRRTTQSIVEDVALGGVPWESGG